MAEPPPIDHSCHYRGLGRHWGSPYWLGNWCWNVHHISLNGSWGCRSSHWWRKHGVWRRRREPQGDRAIIGGGGKFNCGGMGWDSLHVPNPQNGVEGSMPYIDPESASTYLLQSTPIVVMMLGYLHHHLHSCNY